MHFSKQLLIFFLFFPALMWVHAACWCLCSCALGAACQAGPGQAGAGQGRASCCCDCCPGRAQILWSLFLSCSATWIFTHKSGAMFSFCTACYSHFLPALSLAFVLSVFRIFFFVSSSYFSSLIALTAFSSSPFLSITPTILNSPALLMYP